jgi:hypothetical protein
MTKDNFASGYSGAPTNSATWTPDMEIDGPKQDWY